MIRRRVIEYSGRYSHISNVRDPKDIDDDIRAWLTEAVLDTPE